MNLIRWFRRNFIQRHDVIKLDRVHRGDWCDTDYRMIYALFQLFAEFVEKESSIKDLEWQRDYVDEFLVLDSIATRQKDYQELIDLYKWYKASEEMLTTDALDHYDLITEKANTLIRLRGYLWT